MNPEAERSHPDAQSGLLNRLARPFVVLVERWYPDPFVFVVGLTFLAFVAAVTATDTSVVGAVFAWGQGLASLMAFTAQIAITLVSANAFAATGPIARALDRIASKPRTSRQCYALVALAAGLASLVAWPLGLVVGATLARSIAGVAASRSIRVDYPLLVASAYSGFVVWHMGYSGSAPLFVATPGHAMQSLVGIIPVTETILAPWNLALAATVLVVVAAVSVGMEPAADSIRVFDPGATPAQGARQDTAADEGPHSVGDRLSHARAGSLGLAVLLFLYLGLWFTREGLSLNLDVVNWSFVAGGLLLARSPAHYVSLAIEGGRTIGALLIQYPLYAGIMGLLAGSGLADLMSRWIVESATATTLPVWAFLSGGIVNLFVPSGGGQWAIQGPIFLEAGARLGTDPALVVMSVAYGDQWTNMIQPFWTIPLLAIAGLRIRDVMGYTFVTLIVTGLLFVGGLLFVASG